MLGLRSLVFLALFSGAAADAISSANAAKVVAMFDGCTTIDRWNPSPGLAACFAQFAPQMTSCSLAGGPSDFALKNPSGMECISTYFMKMEPTLYSYTTFSIREIAINGTKGFAVWDCSYCGAEPDGITCIPGTLKNIRFISAYTFDDDHNIIGWDNTYPPGAWKELKAIVRRAKESSTAVLASSYEPASVPSTSGYKTAVVGTFITCFALCALAKGSYELGKRGGQADYSSKYSALLQA